MAKLRVQSFAISIDGYGAGPDQDIRNPLGVKGSELMEWFFHTRMWRQMYGEGNGESGIDNDIAEQGFAGIGAGLSGATCSVLSAGRGRTRAGKGGGAKNRRITCRSSF